MATKKQITEQENLKEGKEYLKKVGVKVGSTVYTSITTVSSSGMSRHMKVLVCHENRIVDITLAVSKLGIGTFNRDKGTIMVGGCGMDMGFNVVYSMGLRLYPEGFELKKGQYGRNGNKSGFDRDGGYALQQIWI
jgi:hypothetical protein